MIINIHIRLIKINKLKNYPLHKLQLHNVGIKRSNY